MPTSIYADQTFVAGSFKVVCEGRNTSTTCSIFLKLTNLYPDSPKDLLAQQVPLIFNGLYGNDTMSAFELAKPYTKPIDGQSVQNSDGIIGAQLHLATRRKLALILKSKLTFENLVNIDIMVEVYNKTEMGKKGISSTPKIVL